MKKNETKINVIEIAENKFGKDKLAEIQAMYPGRKLNIIVVEDKVCVLMPMNPKALANYTRTMMDPDGGIDEAARQVLNELWIGGDDEIRDDDEYFMSAMTELLSLIEVKKSASGKY